MSTAISYYDGAILERDLLSIVGKLDALDYDDYSHGRVSSHNGLRWGVRDVRFMANSICGYHTPHGPATRATCTLGLMSGCVEFYWKGGIRVDLEYLPGAEEDGGLLHLKQIRQIEDDLYVVGVQGQVYRRHKGVWSKFNQGLEVPQLKDLLSQGMSTSEALDRTMGVMDLESIDGFDSNALYAVGSRGAVCHKSVGTWIQLTSVTNAHLRRVRVIDRNTVYAAGDNGVLLRGNARTGFAVIPTGIADDLWGLEWFKDCLFVGTRRRGLYRMNGDSIQKVADLPDFDCHTLHAHDGQLLALGSKHIYLTDDAKTWKLLQDPDNE